MTSPLAQWKQLRLVLDLADLDVLRAALRVRLAEGLASDGREIAMIPTFLGAPPPGLEGVVMALDAGGSNLRAARLLLAREGPARVEGEILSEPLPGAGGSPASTDAFLGAHARLLARAGMRDGDPVGWCFSYPILSCPDGDAILLRWTKELAIPGMVGQRVGGLLREALLREGLSAGPVVVLNDTIATLLAGTDARGFDARCGVGLIVGTGTNMGAFLPSSRIGKLNPGIWARPGMAVNFESGAFDPPGLGPVDDAVDRRSADPGRQRFEKAVSGAYLGSLYAEAAASLGLPPPDAPLASEVSRLSAHEEGPAGMLARALIARSADLVAAALAATHDLIGEPLDLHVNAEGTLLERAPGYRERLEATLASLLSGAKAHFHHTENANLVGSARAALGGAGSSLARG
jgi:hexokinase